VAELDGSEGEAVGGGTPDKMTGYFSTRQTMGVPIDWMTIVQLGRQQAGLNGGWWNLVQNSKDSKLQLRVNYGDWTYEDETEQGRVKLYGGTEVVVWMTGVSRSFLKPWSGDFLCKGIALFEQHYLVSAFYSLGGKP